MPLDDLEARPGLTPGGEQGEAGRFPPPAQAKHARDVRAVQVGINEADSAALRVQGQRQVHRDRGLPDAALTARHRDDRHLIAAARRRVYLRHARERTDCGPGKRGRPGIPG